MLSSVCLRHTSLGIDQRFSITDLFAPGTSLTLLRTCFWKSTGGRLTPIVTGSTILTVLISCSSSGWSARNFSLSDIDMKISISSPVVLFMKLYVGN